MLLSAHQAGQAPACALLQLPHHVLQTRHPSHLVENSGIHHLGHLLVELGHLGLIDILGSVASLEQTFNAAHPLNDCGELGVLGDEVFDFFFRDSRALRDPDDSAVLFGEEFGAVSVVQFCVVHGVHHRHETF